jgi:hypothetical protein
VEVPTEVEIKHADFKQNPWVELLKVNAWMSPSIVALHTECFITVDYK